MKAPAKAGAIVFGESSTHVPLTAWRDIMKRALWVLLLVCGAPVLMAQDDRRDAIRELSASNSGATNQSSPEGAAATNRDFVSMLIMAVEAAQDGKPVTLDWNIHRPTMKSTIQLEAVLTQPDLASNITEKLTDAAAVDRLKRSLSYADDVTATITWTNADKIEEHLKALPVAKVSARNQVLSNKRQAAADVGAEEARPDEEIITKVARRAAAREAEAKTPQFYVSGSYRRRSRLAGADEWKAKATYEQPMGMMAQAKSRNTRMAFSIELNGTKTNEFDLGIDIPSPPTIEPTKASHTYVGRASIGSDIYRPPDPNHTGRLDLALSYDDVTGDADKNNRLVGTISYTQKLNEKTSLPIALIYANKRQYVTDVNKRLSVHFGLSFKLSDM
jgi:hypothetical protein